MRLLRSLAYLIPLFCMFTPPLFAVPNLLNYQGQLTATSNDTLPNPISITFSIFNAEEAGQSLWQENQMITHKNGIFHTLLGNVSPLPENLFQQDGTRYLEIRLQNEPAFQPRQRIVSVAYAIQANNVSGHITPKSLTIGKVKIDTANVSTSHITTDSLIVGQKGIINRNGQWTGPSIPVQLPGMILDTIIVRNYQDSLAFGSVSWADIDGSSDVFTTFINLRTTSFLDIEFHTTTSATGELVETRLAVEPIDPKSSPITNISNISRFVPRNSSDLGNLNNQAVLNLTPGLYRVFIQGRIEGLGTFQTGVLTVRSYHK